MSGREKIIARYLEQARTDPWEPGVCSFCGERPVVAWFEGPTFRTFVRSSTDVRANEVFLACETCLELVETDDRTGLAERGAARKRRRPDARTVEIARQDQREAFWQRRRSDRSE
jgi:hypothetical protein